MGTAPKLDGAACRRYFSPDYWLGSASPDEREAARWICLTACPALEACRQWALALPLDTRGTIAGLGQAERQQIRSQQREREAASLAARRGYGRLRRQLGIAETPEQMRQRYAANPEPRKAYQNAYYQAHREEIIAKRRERHAAKRAVPWSRSSSAAGRQSASDCQGRATIRPQKRGVRPAPGPKFPRPAALPGGASPTPAGAAEETIFWLAAAESSVPDRLAGRSLDQLPGPQWCGERNADCDLLDGLSVAVRIRVDPRQRHPTGMGPGDEQRAMSARNRAARGDDPAIGANGNGRIDGRVARRRREVRPASREG
jgi:hypothetical protein